MGRGRGRFEPPVMPVSGFEGRAVRALVPYLWPKGEVGLKTRVERGLPAHKH